MAIIWEKIHLNSGRSYLISAVAKTSDENLILSAFYKNPRNG